jgi:predicted HAD superfamily Cof-like phosphohydrolase
MTKLFTDVTVFMKAAGQETPSSPQKIISKQAQLYKDLIKEESIEFWEAEAASDDVEEIDACFDMIWVIIGYMKSRGWDCEGIWDEGAKSNLSKIDRVTNNVLRREDGKILKPEGWMPPDFSKFASK